MGGQAGAVRLAVSRALCNWDHGLHGWLKGAGCLSRDRRVVERKKTGRKPVPLFVVDVCACIYCFYLGWQDDLPFSFLFRIAMQKTAANFTGAFFFWQESEKEIPVGEEVSNPEHVTYR